MSIDALRQYLELLKNSGIKELYPPEMSKAKLLDKHRHKYANCTNCALNKTRNNFVYGEGNPDAIAMLIGEAPGEQEDKTGRPFVGAAGQLLEKMLAAINLDRKDVYIANIVKCRPPGNRNPEPVECMACLPYLLEQIEIIQPKMLLILGLVSAHTLLNNNNTLGWHREKIHNFKGIPAFVTYHPSALLRNPEWKKLAWIDLQEFAKEYQKIASSNALPNSEAAKKHSETTTGLPNSDSAK